MKEGDYVIEKDYMIEKDAVEKESVYIYDKTLFDIIQSKLILQVKTPVVIQFARRTYAYEIGVVVYVIKVSPTLPPFLDMSSNEEKIAFVKNNWRDFVRLALSGMYEVKDLEMIRTEIKTYGNAYERLNPVLPGEKVDVQRDACSYFREKFPELDYYHVYNGYSTNGLSSYCKIYGK